MVGVKRFTDEELDAKKKARIKAWKDANKEKVQAYNKNWREKNSEHVTAYVKRKHKEDVERDGYQQRYWEKNLKAFYKMSVQEFNEFWCAQEGKCAICKCILAPRGRTRDSVAIDHNHSTGAVRGLLCRNCNNGIGCLKDNPDVLESAAAYLRKNGHYG